MKTWRFLRNIFWGMLFYLQYSIFLIPFTSFCMPAVSVTSTGKKLPPLYWNNSNPLFSTTSDNKITVNLFDSIDVYCPYYPPMSDNSTWEYYVIYLVSKAEYDQCTVFDPSKSLMIINCSNPTKSDVFFTIWIDPFQGFPNTPDFSSGNTYYMISSSTGKPGGLSNQYQDIGACHTKNMKLKIDICCSSTNNNTQDSSSTSTTTPGGQQTQPPATPNPPTQQTTTTKKPITAAPTPTPTTTTQKPSSTTKFPGGKPSDPSQQIVIDATGNKNSGLINNARTLRPSLTLIVLMTLTYLIQPQR
ncbi:ephrin-B2-like isoform X3 [Mytilus edulis]|uniref:Ephrin-B n=1 Tax=Mytilus galloprovincialis TaxID=29158 RepID=A0A8B6C5T9_MYTGA|nr:ephrin-B [Mytilus galloprovincialis]